MKPSANVTVGTVLRSDKATLSLKLRAVKVVVPMWECNYRLARDERAAQASQRGTNLRNVIEELLSTEEGANQVKARARAIAEAAARK